VSCEKTCAMCSTSFTVLGSSHARKYCDSCAPLALKEWRRKARERRDERHPGKHLAYMREYYRKNRSRWVEYDETHRNERNAASRRRLRAIRAAHDLALDAVNERNQAARAEAWREAKAAAGADLLALIEDQERDENRRTVGGRWVVRLDADLPHGPRSHDFYSSFRYDGGPWADPVFDAVAARLDIRQRLAAA
jgi:hypothetical protein